ncbi:MAG: hypothetical protein RJA78_64 [Actinomycetota bacterium]
MNLVTKAVTAVATLCLGLSTISPAAADYTPYWPEFGTLSEHNEWAINAMGGKTAHAIGATGKGIKVAVLDSGISMTTPGLSEKVIAYKDFQPSQPPLPEHGTQTASSVAADYDALTGVGGIAPGASLLIGRVCYLIWCDTDAAKQAINWAIAQDADVISMSFGGSFEPEMIAALANATRQGIVVVIAMGNSGCSSYEYWGINTWCTQERITENSFAMFPISGLIGAGASSQTGARASFSSWGPNLDLLAPGVGIVAHDPIAVSNGFGGTSAATPFIAGVAALVLEANPNLTPAQVQAILQASTRPALETKPKVWESCVRDEASGKRVCTNEVDSVLPQSYFTGAGLVAADKAVLLARRVAANNTFAAPDLVATATDVSVSWQGASADVYVNSKLVAQDAVSPFIFTGDTKQSFAVQLSRGATVSTPALAILRVGTVPLAPNVVEHRFLTNQITFRTDDIPQVDPDIPWLPNPWSSDIGALFEFEDGRAIPCKGYSPSVQPTDRPFVFTCKSTLAMGPIAGKFRLVSPDGTLGHPSQTFSGTVLQGDTFLQVRTTYLSSDSIRFAWDEVPGALSYEYRYKPDGTMVCASEKSVEVIGNLGQPSAFWVGARASSDCTGNLIAQSEYLPFRLLDATPAKPSNIRIVEVRPTHIHFEGQLTSPDNSWRIYRSDGLFMRYDGQGSRMMLGIQPNEDVNGKTFSYRFMEVAHDMWGDTYSPLSDPISVSFAPLGAPSGKCSIRGTQHSYSCDVRASADSDGTLIEFLDAEGNVISSKETKRWTSQRFNIQRVRGAQAVRFTSTSGDVPNWYRRGDSVTVPISRSPVHSKYIFTYAQ